MFFILVCCSFCWQKWIKRAGKALVTYANGCTYEGNCCEGCSIPECALMRTVLPGDFNSEKMKHGNGVYTWVEPDEESGEAKKVASYEGKYADGKKNGFGKMTFPNGDVYVGEWKDNKVLFGYVFSMRFRVTSIQLFAVFRLKVRERTHMSKRRIYTVARGWRASRVEMGATNTAETRVS